MREVKCDNCGNLMTKSTQMGKSIEVTIKKGSYSARYDCCSDECAQNLFEKLHKNWLGNN
ncbi:unknown [Firmicutes bacterium CAG:646]|nr:unknown [Firmicutes bacterium CAG:646]